MYNPSSGDAQGQIMDPSFDVKASREHLAARLAAQWEQAEARRRAALALVRAAIRQAGPGFAAVRRVYLFGSVLSPGQFRPDSDIDVGVEGELSAADFFGLWRAIEEDAPGWEIDLVELDRARPQFAERVRSAGELIYAA
jgi:predicted nucleotidyltransferase